MNQKHLVLTLIFSLIFLSVLGFFAAFPQYFFFFTNKESVAGFVKKQTSQTFILKSDISGYGLRIADFKALDETAKEIGVFGANAVQLTTTTGSEAQAITAKQVHIVLISEPSEFTSAKLDKDKNKTSAVQVLANPAESALVINVWLSESVLTIDELSENLNKYVLFGMYYAVKNRNESLDQVEARVKQKYMGLIENEMYPLMVVEKN